MNLLLSIEPCEYNTLYVTNLLEKLNDKYRKRHIKDRGILMSVDAILSEKTVVHKITACIDIYCTCACTFELPKAGDIVVGRVINSNKESVLVIDNKYDITCFINMAKQKGTRAIDLDSTVHIKIMATRFQLGKYKAVGLLL